MNRMLPWAKIAISQHALQSALKQFKEWLLGGQSLVYANTLFHAARVRKTLPARSGYGAIPQKIIVNRNLAMDLGLLMNMWPTS
jgi:hypothetical protein